MNEQVLKCLEIIEQCNNELRHLATKPNEANKRVPGPGIYRNQKITRKNQIELDRDEQVRILRRILSDYNLGLRSSAHQVDENSGQRYLAFIDILGFSEIVRNNSHEELTRFVNFLIRDVQSYMVSEDVGKTKTKLYAYGLAPDFSDATLNSLMLSDTILFWTKDDSAESFYEIVKSIRNLMFFETNYTNVALRGVINVGELSFLNFDIPHPTLTINQSTLFGKSIVDAYHTEGKQEWIGCLVTPAALELYITKEPDVNKLTKVLNDFLIEYDVPMKGNITEKHNVIKWTYKTFNERDKENIKKCFTRHQKANEITNEAVIRKYENTLAFAEFTSHP